MRGVVRKPSAAVPQHAQASTLRSILACAFDAMIVLGRGARIREANPPACRLFGRSSENMLGKRLSELGVTKLKYGPQSARAARRAAGEVVFSIERPNGSSVRAISREFAVESPPARVCILRKMTPDRAALQTLESNSRLLMEAERVGGVGGWEMDVNTGLLAWTPEMARNMGMPLDTDNVTVEESYNFYTEASRAIVREAFNATLARGTPYDLVLEGITADGRRIWVREVCRAVIRKGRLVSVIGFSQDITEQRRLAGLLNDIGNQERARIGADLHDGLGQELTGLALLLRSVARRAERESSVLATELAGLSKLTSKSIETVREIAHGLLPLRLSHAGFRQELRRLARATRATFGAQVSIRFQGDNAHMPIGETAENLYRIAQEAIANAVKHGHATSVALRVRASDTRIVFTVSDNGSGIEPGRNSEGMGLQIMRYRTQMLGGLIDVHPNPKGGTRLRCVMPRNSLSS